jgi:hypothetical protein
MAGKSARADVRGLHNLGVAMPMQVSLGVQQLARPGDAGRDLNQVSAMASYATLSDLMPPLLVFSAAQGPPPGRRLGQRRVRERREERGFVGACGPPDDLLDHPVIRPPQQDRRAALPSSSAT